MVHEHSKDTAAVREKRARQVVATLRQEGFCSYFAGGCVRDRLLGIEPRDFDIATAAPTTTVQQIFPRTVPVGVQFGVVLVIVHGQPIEVATFRSDATYEDGRHPTAVSDATPMQDAQRRDFTINGMFYDPETEAVIDYVGGRADLEAGIVRAIGDPHARLGEDRLRLLRAARFAARFGYVIEPATLAAMRDLAPTVTTIAWERIGDELVRILTEGPARRGLELLDESGLLSEILPEITRMKGVAQSPDYHPEGDVFRHTLLAMEQLAGPPETLALGVLLHDVGKPVCAGRKAGRITFYGHCERGEEMARVICRRLRRSREVWERVAYLVRNHLRPLSARDMRRSTLRRFLAEDGIDELLALLHADSLASSGDLSAFEFCTTARTAFGDEPLRPPPLIGGRDLIKLGYAPGPLFARILAGVEEAQLEGTLDSREAACAWVRSHFPPPAS